MNTDKVHLTDDDIFTYMEQWRNDEQWTDFSLMADYGYDYLMADWLVSAGVIDPAACYPEVKQYEVGVLKLAKEYRAFSKKKRDQIFWECFEGVHTYRCKHCNHVSFLSAENKDLYESELKTCWSCRSDSIEYDVMKRKR